MQMEYRILLMGNTVEMAGGVTSLVLGHTTDISHKPNVKVELGESQPWI